MITEYTLRYSDREITIRIRRSARRSMGLEVRASGEVLARIPARLPDGELKRFLEQHRDWIYRKEELVRNSPRQQDDTGAVPVQELTLQETERIKQKIAARVQYYSARMGVSVGRITIRNQKTRWGSCSAKGNLNFNYQLYYLPDELLDYVVVHELAHRKHMNHSQQFWQEVERYFPGYRECRRRLREIRLV